MRKREGQIHYLLPKRRRCQAQMGVSSMKGLQLVGRRLASQRVSVSFLALVMTGRHYPNDKKANR